MEKKSVAVEADIPMRTIGEEVYELPEELRIYGTRNEMKLAEATHKPGVNELPGVAQANSPKLCNPPNPKDRKEKVVRYWTGLA